MSQITQVINSKPLKTPGLWLPIMFVLFTSSLLILIIFATLAYQVFYLNRLYPGVFVAGIDAGGMTQAEVITALNQRTWDELARPITLQFENKTWTFTGRELGLHVDVSTTAHKAFAIGRTGNFLTDTFTQLNLMAAPRHIDPVLQYDTGPTTQALQRVADEIEQSPRDAQLIIQPDASVEAVPAQRGRRMHIEATRPLLESAIFANEHQPITPVVQEIIPGLMDVEIARQQAENLLSDPIIFRYSEGADTAEWRIEPQTLVEYIDVVETVDANGKTHVSLELDQEKFIAYFEELAQTVKREPVDAKFEINSETGELIVLKESQDGRALDIEAAYQQVVALKERPATYVELPVLLTSPAVSSKNIESLGIKELVSEATSYFKGSSQSRMRNIALSASRFHGVIVPPGEIFSFNHYLGPVTKEAGFDESLIIQGNRTSVGLGGGVCQVSTTAFRVAFFGGYEIVERWAHGYRVGWYETNSGPGLDATVYTPDIDFRFRNDTDYYLLIQTATDLEAGTVTFRFYSTPTGREVTVSEPEETNLVKHGPPIYEEDPSLPKGTTKQVDWANDGLDVSVKRIVKEGETVIHEDEIFSHYSPWQAVYKVGTGG